MNYIFDVDGTLTPARKQIDPYFKEFILKFFKTHHCYLASGSDFEKIKWQVEELTLDAQGVFGCSGNEYYENDQLIYSNDWQVPFELETKLTELLLTSTYDKRHGNHIEKRIGAINFSICGRDATHEQRQEYYLWDKERQERQKFTAELSKSFPEVSFVVERVSNRL
jgi:phosphomannomutase